MDVVQQLERARKSYRQQAWADAYEAFCAVDAVAALDAEDLERLGEAADMLGLGDETVRVLQRAYQAHAAAERVGASLRCAFWLSTALAVKGEFAQLGGWAGRASRLAAKQSECPEMGYLLLLEANQHEHNGDHAAVFQTAGRAAELGRPVATAMWSLSPPKTRAGRGSSKGRSRRASGYSTRRCSASRRARRQPASPPGPTAA